jgi:hypothetical protein
LFVAQNFNTAIDLLGVDDIRFTVPTADNDNALFARVGLA